MDVDCELGGETSQFGRKGNRVSSVAQVGARKASRGERLSAKPQLARVASGEDESKGDSISTSRRKEVELTVQGRKL